MVLSIAIGSICRQCHYNDFAIEVAELHSRRRRCPKHKIHVMADILQGLPVVGIRLIPISAVLLYRTFILIGIVFHADPEQLQCDAKVMYEIFEVELITTTKQSELT